tara:strand:+ start:487 stop:747 length:261 start_codon:yes stop_codon:yes gene_type:complete
MIYQLSDGRIIELSVETFLELTDEEIHELSGLSSVYTKNVASPFYAPYNQGKKTTKEETPDESEIELPDLDPQILLDDNYFHPDDE